MFGLKEMIGVKEFTIWRTKRRQNCKLSSSPIANWKVWSLTESDSKPFSLCINWTIFYFLCMFFFCISHINLFRIWSNQRKVWNKDHPPCRVEMNETLSLFSKTVYYFSASSQSASLTRTRIPFRLGYKRNVHFSLAWEHVFFVVGMIFL